MRQRLNLVALLVLVTAGPVDAQISSEGTVRGVVRDAAGGVLPGVTLTAVSPTVPGTHVGVSESDGQYRLLNLQPGVFDVVAELAGFTSYTRQGVEVRAGLNLTLDIVLALGSVEESITVRGGSPLLETHKPIKAVNIAGDDDHWRLVQHVRRQDVARRIRGVELRRPGTHLRLGHYVGGTAGRQRSRRHHGQQSELQCDAGQQAHRAS
jgi:hypothetical protein